MTRDAPAHAGERSQFRLIGERRFGPFFATQFLGAFNDNVLKNAIVILITFEAVRLGTLAPPVAVNIAAGLFVLPFFLFSASAGQLADKYDKATIIRWVKAAEIPIMALAAVGFVRGDAVVLFVSLFLMGLQSTLFGPVKYSILPQVLAERELVGGNALLESATFLAILLGTILGGVLVAVEGGSTTLVPAVTIALAVAGYLASRGVPGVPAPDPGLRFNWNPVSETARNLRFAYGNRTVFLSLLGISWFWFYGALFLSQVPAFVRDYLGGDESVATLFLAVFSIGIGAGSLLVERMSGHKVEIGLVPFGAIGLTVFALDLFFASPGPAAGAPMGVGAFLAQPGTLRILADLVLVSLFGGFYAVPLYALVQTRAEKSHQSRIIAANNILNAAFMVAAALLAATYLHLGVTVPQLFLVTALLNAAVAAFIFTLVPEFLMRFLAWLLIHSAYRLRKTGLAHIPEEGPAVIAANHVSFVDAVVIMGASPRPIRFLMDHAIFRIPVLSFIFRTARAIPIAGRKEDPALLERAFVEAATALRSGELVGIFPEGRITETGELGPFRPGISRILAEVPVPVVPMALRGLWGSFFSRKGGPAMTKPFRRGLFSRIELAVGAPMAPESATPEALHAEIARLRGDVR
ncbi:MAG: MFS transporter [Burkholderiales bacterium]|nr:MFS transporter [Burkholderiales bacterium]